MDTKKLHETHSVDWVHFLRSYEPDETGKYYDLNVSLDICNLWLKHHDIDKNEFCSKITDFLSDSSSNILEICGEDYCGQKFIFDSLLTMSRHYITYIALDYTVKKCLDAKLASVTCRHKSLLLPIEIDVPLLLFTREGVSPAYTLTKPFAWFDGYDNKSLNPDMWKKMLKFRGLNCYGCLIDHPSQIQHQGFGGCLASDEDTIL